MLPILRSGIPELPSTPLTSRSWRMQEDDSLRALIQRYGEKKWAVVASELGTKSSKQCRRRWKNALSIDAKATEWTTEEDSMLVRLHRELGNKWTEISRRFGDRTDNAVKNRWHALCRKQPNLAQELSPLTTVGVRRGTRTRPASQSSSDDYSEGGPSKRRRRGTSSGAGTSAGPSHATHPQQGAAGPSRQARGAKGLPLPTPFDQRAAPPASVIYVNRVSALVSNGMETHYRFGIFVLLLLGYFTSRMETHSRFGFFYFFFGYFTPIPPDA